MSDMRLIVAGAGGRMGRTLVKAIADTAEVTLAGATETPSATVIGKDAGELAGLGPAGVKVSATNPDRHTETTMVMANCL